MNFLKQYIIAALLFLILDSIWLGILAREMYQVKLGPVVNLEFDFGVAAFFYLFYIAGMVFFAIKPALEEGSSRRALINGMALGGLCYATYDLTNMATIANWPLYVVIADILSGMFITGSCAFITCWIVQKWSNG